MKRIIVVILALTLLFSLTFPMPAMAKTKWDLEGWREAQNKWMDGLLWTWHENDYVPYRLRAEGYDGTTTDIYVQHDYLDGDGHYGIDGAQNFWIGEYSDRYQTPGSISYIYEAGVSYPGWGVIWDVVWPPTIVPISNGAVLEFHFEVYQPDALTALGDFSFYWEAHCSWTGSPNITFPGTIDFGSSYWNGASLHAHTSVTGNQDVPIKTPPEVGGNPSIDVELLNGCAYTDEWGDDDVPPGYIGRAGLTWWFKYIVTNTGDVPLTGITLHDDVIGDISVPAAYDPLLPGDSFEVIYGPVIAISGQYESFAIACGDYAGTTYCSDADYVYYFGN